MEFTPQYIWSHMGLPVRIIMLLILIMAIGCVFVAIERTWALYTARAQSRSLAQSIGPLLANSDAAGALALAQEKRFKRSYLGHMLIAGLTEFNNRPDKYGIEAAERALERVSISEGSDLRRGLNILATTGSTAPFVGLVGTIFGIINAFAGMAEAGGGGISAVAGGIAEALVARAIGIAVALLGVWLFNFFTALIDNITNDMVMSTQELIDWCHKQVLPPMSADTAAK
ncbi:MAG: MotA/TolQ/ExbB proton channel family protein [Myxococcota bacterium]